MVVDIMASSPTVNLGSIKVLILSSFIFVSKNTTGIIKKITSTVVGLHDQALTTGKQ